MHIYKKPLLPIKAKEAFITFFIPVETGEKSIVAVCKALHKASGGCHSKGEGKQQEPHNNCADHAGCSKGNCQKNNGK